MNETMEDQQVTSHQLAWLAGIMDGEGTFSIIYQGKKYGDAYIARITLSNTDIAMINEILKILDSYEINGHLWKEEPRKKQHKAAYHITINKLNKLKKLVELILPYLVNKKPNAEILNRFVSSRLKYKKEPIKDKKTGKIIGMEKKGHSQEEKDWYKQMSELNK